MRKIIFIILMNCSFVFGQNSDEFVLGQWYLASGCISKKVGAWATNPAGAPKFCFSKTKSTSISNPNMTFIQSNPEYIENVIWTFSASSKSKTLICEYIKDIVLKLSKINDKITSLETKTDVSYKNKYYWIFDNEKEVLRIYNDKKLSSLLVEFKIDKKDPLVLIKQ
jgi:hypothetical protein